MERLGQFDIVKQGAGYRDKVKPNERNDQLLVTRMT